MAKPICLKLLTQAIRAAFSLAVASAGRSIAARMAIMAITTSNSINVNAFRSSRWLDALQPATDLTRSIGFQLRFLCIHLPLPHGQGLHSNLIQSSQTARARSDWPNWPFQS